MTLQADLARLEASGLISLAVALPELEYLFRHTLIHDVAYGSLVRQDRRNLHLAAGEALERLYPDRLTSRELAPLLGQHFHEADDDPRALKYFTLAGDAAAAVYANAEAALHYGRALDVAKHGSATPEALARLFTGKGRALELNGRYPEALANYDEMESLARQRRDRPMELSALVLRGQIRSTANVMFSPELGEALSQQALALAQEMGDRAAEAKILWNRMNLHRFIGNLPQARDFGDRSLALAREFGLREQMAYTLNDLAHVYAVTAGLASAVALLREARDLWREFANLPMLADSLSTACLYHAFAGDYDAALSLSQEAFRVSQSIRNLWGQSYSISMVGYVHWERGDPGRAVEVMEDSIALGEQAGYVVAEVQTRAVLASLYGDLGAVDRGLELAALAARRAEESFPPFRALALAVLTEQHLLAGDLMKAESALEACLAADRTNPLVALRCGQAACRAALAKADYESVIRTGNDLFGRLRDFGLRPFALEALFLLGQTWLAMGDTGAARDKLAAALAEAEALGSRRMSWPILAALSEVEAKCGNAVEAQSLQSRAREIVGYIADHMPPALRDSFLSRPDVRAVMVD